MRKLIAFLILSTMPLAAQTGTAAAETAQVTQSNSWKTWTFLGIVLVTITAGVVVCALDNGQSTH